MIHGKTLKNLKVIWDILAIINIVLVRFVTLIAYKTFSSDLHGSHDPSMWDLGGAAPLLLATPLYTVANTSAFLLCYCIDV